MSDKSKTQRKMEDKHPSFVEEVAGLQKEQLKEKLSTLARHRQEIIQDKESNAELKELKAELKEMEAPYRDALSANDLKMRYVYELMQEKGHA